jgi:DNA recombination protein RmuC
MFVPGDQFMDAALSRRPELLDAIGRHNVILASPSTLIAMLRAVAVGFQEQKLSQTAREVGKLVRELRDRLGNALGHVHKVGENLQRAVASYNEFVGSYERRLMPQMNRLADATPGGELAQPEIKPIELSLRSSSLFGPGSVVDEDRAGTGALPPGAGKDGA